MEKALIKSTGEILDIKNEYRVFNVKVSFGDNYKNVLKLFDTYKEEITFENEIMLEPNEIVIHKPDKTHSKYVLNNNITYDSDELVVGISDIISEIIKNIIYE